MPELDLGQRLPCQHVAELLPGIAAILAKPKRVQIRPSHDDGLAAARVSIPLQGRNGLSSTTNPHVADEHLQH